MLAYTCPHTARTTVFNVSPDWRVVLTWPGSPFGQNESQACTLSEMHMDKIFACMMMRTRVRGDPLPDTFVQQPPTSQRLGCSKMMVSRQMRS